MPTFAQAFLLGTDRLNAAPTAPHPALAESWQALAWAESKEAALLDAAALLGATAGAGAMARTALPAPDSAPAETHPIASMRAVAVLRQLLAEEWRPLLPEWLECCAARRMIVPPFFLRALYQLATTARDRELVRLVAGERGRWLARQNAEWAWINTGDPAAPLDPTLWDTGTAEERLNWFQRTRQAAPEEARVQLEKTWANETPDFRAQAIAALRTGLGFADEPFLTRTLKDRRKEVRQTAQGLLASLPGSALSVRLRTRAEALLGCSRGLLGRKLELTLPDGFDASWAADGIEEKPPAGLGEKAFWTQQILALVPLRHWTRKFGLEPDKLVELASKSGDWADLLLGAWFRTIILHRDAEEAAAALRPILARQKTALPALNPQVIAADLLAVCDESRRWALVAAEPDTTWAALPLLTGTPKPAESRALLDYVAKVIRDGYNPGGSPAAILVARRLPPSLRDEAVRLMTRENGLSKPAEAFLQALELRAAIHEAFNSTPPSRP